MKGKKNRKKTTAEQLAGKAFTVHVTRHDILKGRPHSQISCPIALALKRATGVKDVKVSGDHIYVDGLDGVVTPYHIETFVSEFDEVLDDNNKRVPPLKRVRPFRFRLTLPVPEVRIEGIDGDIEILD